MELRVYLNVKGNVKAFKQLCGGGGLIATQCHLPCMQIGGLCNTVNPELELERHFNQVQVHLSQEVSKGRIYSA